MLWLVLISSFVGISQLRSISIELSVARFNQVVVCFNANPELSLQRISLRIQSTPRCALLVSLEATAPPILFYVVLQRMGRTITTGETLRRMRIAQDPNPKCLCGCRLNESALYFRHTLLQSHSTFHIRSLTAGCLVVNARLSVVAFCAARLTQARLTPCFRNQSPRYTATR